MKPARLDSSRIRYKIQFFTLVVIGIILFAHAPAFAQNFVVDGTPLNGMTIDDPLGAYTGCVWFDYDNDGLMDMAVAAVNGNRLYHNEGGGFMLKISAIDAGDFGRDSVRSRGITFGDYNADGLMDLCVAGDISFLYRNTGAVPRFEKVLTGGLGTGVAAGWSPSFADFDADGDLDLYITHPVGFVPGGAKFSHLFTNDGPPSYTLTKVPDLSTDVTSVFAPYTSGNWSDYDLDGDIDLIVGSGPATGGEAADYLYQNQLVETGIADLIRLTGAGAPLIATDPGDGQVWNLIDYDNDGDFDAFRTNWGNPNPAVRVNDLYRNDAGTFVKLNMPAMTTDPVTSLANTWGDFDNDGDLDCFVANDAGQNNDYFVNNGDGTFTETTSGVIVQFPVTSYCSAAADYDNDGDLDLHVHGVNRIFYRNDLANGNGWLKIKLQGVVSNLDAIGARIRIKATIGGTPTWQMREISTQNSFLGSSSPIVHFGLGDAAIIDSIQIFWPSGEINDTTDVAISQYLTMVEKCADPDADGVSCFDNCPDVPNPGQEDSNSNGLGDACDCACDCHGDPQCDGFTNVLDVVFAVNSAFKGAPDVIDPNPVCPRTTTDVDCNGFTNVLDVVKFVNVAFRGETAAAQFCSPCP